MRLSDDDRRALGVVLGLLVIASAARWLERPRDLLLDAVPALDVAALEDASRAAKPAPRAPAGASGDRIDPNTASAEELQRLPGVGPAMAQRIVAERENAPFRSAADLQRVRGIGPAQAARLAEHVTLPPDGPAPPTSGRGPAPDEKVVAGAPARNDEPGTLIDLNRATAAELQAVPGVGPVLAARLLARRDSLGRFRDWAEVDAVSGVGPALLARIRDRARIAP